MVTCYECGNDKACIWVPVKVGKLTEFAAMCKACARVAGAGAGAGVVGQTKD